MGDTNATTAAHHSEVRPTTDEATIASTAAKDWCCVH